MKLTMLGTGNALVTECYNTCYVIEDAEQPQGQQLFMVDGGGGGAILAQLKHAGINYLDIHEIFVTHKHVDHIMGIVWMVRVICQAMAKGQYKGECNIYAHDEVIGLIRMMATSLLTSKQTKFIDERLHLIEVTDGETRIINGRAVTFFDIASTKAKQFGYMLELGEGKRLCCCGDEPYNPCEEKYAKGATWLFHEAFCLFEQADIFSPYEKHHSTAKDAAELAEQLGVENLLLYHTEDKNLAERKRLYTEEAKRYFHGNVYVPEDLEVIEL